MVFVADDLAAWLVGLFADAGRKRLTAWVLGRDDQRALRSAASTAVRLTAEEMRPGDSEGTEELARVISEVFAAPTPSALVTGQATLLEALQAGVAGQLTVLDDRDLTGTGKSSAELLRVSTPVLAENLTSNLVREIVARGARGGPLEPLAGQLNHDVTHLQGQRLEGMIGRIAQELQEALARLIVTTPLPSTYQSSGSQSTITQRYATSSRLARKLQSLAKQAVLQTTLIGGVYLDIVLYPVDTEQLDHREWANLEGIRMQLGGSAYYLGKYLYDRYGQESELVTIVGDSSDPLSSEAARLLDTEAWIRNEMIVDRTRSGTPISIHLVQRSETFTTIFTYRGALDHLSWEDIFLASSAVKQDEPALIYISGYFRSNLYRGLVERLRVLSKRHVIALDHGRVNPEADNPQCAVALREAFKRGYIDVYVCTFRELWALDKSPVAEQPPPGEMRTQQLLMDIAARLNVPPVTVVRGEDWPGEGVAYLLLDGVPHVVEDTGERTGSPTGGVGPKNAFNAAFLRSLIDPDLSPELIIRAVRTGLGAWMSNC
jgi:hypothetical protein